MYVLWLIKIYCFRNYFFLVLCEIKINEENYIIKYLCDSEEKKNIKKVFRI